MECSSGLNFRAAFLTLKNNNNPEGLSMKYETLYFDEPGPMNTDETLGRVREYAEKHGTGTVLIATTTGKTALKALSLLPGKKIIAVTHAAGFDKENEQELLPKNREKIEQMGGRILTCQHALAGISRAVRFKFKTYEIDEIVANTLRIMGQGVKVAVEIALMAADAGLVRTEEDVLSVAGTGAGADTAIVLKPNNVCRFFDVVVRGILCKPWTI